MVTSLNLPEIFSRESVKARSRFWVAGAFPALQLHIYMPLVCVWLQGGGCHRSL